MGKLFHIAGYEKNKILSFSFHEKDGKSTDQVISNNSIQVWENKMGGKLQRVLITTVAKPSKVICFYVKI